MVYKYSHAASHSACRAKLLTPLNLASWSPECHIGFLFNFKPAAILHQKAILDHKLWAKDQGNCPAIVQRAFLWRPFPGFIAITFLLPLQGSGDVLYVVGTTASLWTTSKRERSLSPTGFGCGISKDSAFFSTWT